MLNKQHTISREYSFRGKGLHTGENVIVSLKPADAGRGIFFCRTDLPGAPCVKASAMNVRATERGTVIQDGKAVVSTVEHLLACTYAIGIDNLRVDITGPEIPIMDGSAMFFSDLLSGDPLASQNRERSFFSPQHPVHISDEKSGSTISFFPSDELSITVTVDFNSEVLGVQSAFYDEKTDFHTQIAPSRTFVFVHDLIPLLGKNLIKGGDLENAVVIAEQRVESGELSELKKLFGYSGRDSIERGFVNSRAPVFENECARHKLLDLMGDLALSGVRIKARIEAEKPGHSINTEAAKKIISWLK
jgi:UDP-3-O-[3-hydroxymyristoyl] N-acetylglucosamine deacetylase/3-hydroxyacyl-[acyl-carrier-protein] dehydratase